VTQKIIIHEVGPRDGLQAERVTVPLEEKIRWIEGLFSSGIDIIQLGSFVNPEKMPQMADTDALFEHVNLAGSKPERVTLSGLVLNEKGLERGMACGVEMFCMGVSASETHSRKNTGMSTEEALSRIIPMAKSAVLAGKRVQVSVQSAFGCGYEGQIPVDRVLRIVNAYLEAGLYNLSLADTAGHAYPAQVEELYKTILQLDNELELACHFHNTYGLGLANCIAALRSGVTIFETAFGGLGGCPFTKVPAGNVSTEDWVHSLQRMGFRGDIHLDDLLAVARQVGKYFNRDLPGFILKSGSIVHFEKSSG
jgi:hydroxymethylglutaryl-CoA lyase